MKVYTGGIFAGQEELAKQSEQIETWLDGAECKKEELFFAEGILRFHELVYRMVRDGEPVQEFVKQLVEKNPQLVIVSDETGCGIVPLGALEREYREQAGRAVNALAAASEQVIRVVCGIGVRLK